MNIYKTIEFKTDTKEQSQVAQLIAYSYGYKWAGQNDVEGKPTCYYITQPYLFFNPNTKVINYSNTPSKDFSESTTLITSTYLLINAFELPEKKSFKVFADFELFSDGSVSYKGSVIPKGNFDEVVDQRKSLLRKIDTVVVDNNKFSPIVSFNYKGNNRKLILLSDTDTHIGGLDIDDGNTYKSFTKGSIDSPIKFIGFNNKNV